MVIGNIEQLVENGTLIDSGGSANCNNCAEEVGVYTHRYDDEITAYICDHCKYSEWLTDIPSVNNPRVCSSCGEFVTEEDEVNDNVVQCGITDPKGRFECDFRAHKECVDPCSICGWLCTEHEFNYLECDSCSRWHEQDHIVSLDTDFVEAWGHICKDCFDRDNDENEQSEDQGNVGEQNKTISGFTTSNAAQGAILNFATVRGQIKREDSSAFLSHFFGRGGKTENECYDDLVSVLTQGKLEANTTGYFGTYTGSPNKTNISKAVCFTEGRLNALFEHCLEFSMFGISYLKFWLHRNHNAAPAVYIHDDLIKTIRDEIPDSLVPYVNKIACDNDYDYHHEREWRCPADIHFQISDVKLVYAPIKYHDRIRSETDYKGQILCLDQVKVI